MGLCGCSLLAIAAPQAKETAHPPTPAHKLNADIHKEQGITCMDCHETEPKKAVTRDKCQQCHGTYADIAKRTENLEPNPHYNHTIDLDCNDCHHQHRPMEIYCHNCHKDLAFIAKPKAPAAADKEGK